MTTPLPTWQEADANEAAAMTDLIAAVPGPAARELGAEVRTFDCVTAIAVAATRSAFYNRVIGFGTLQRPTLPLLEEIALFYRARGTPFMVGLGGEDAEAPDIEAWLTSNCLRRERDWLVIARNGEAAPTASAAGAPRVREVAPAEGALFATTFCEGYGLPDEWAPLYEGLVGRPGWKHFFATDDDGAPIGTGSMYFTEVMVWHGNGSTVPSARGRGAHGAISSRRVETCVGACRAMTAETWSETPDLRNSSLHNHLRAGWRQLGVRRNVVCRG